MLCSSMGLPAIIGLESAPRLSSLAGALEEEEENQIHIHTLNTTDLGSVVARETVQTIFARQTLER